jgi:hypothetical protein
MIINWEECEEKEMLAYFKTLSWYSPESTEESIEMNPHLDKL